MRITIDNEDGRGAVEYTAAVLAEGPITVTRELNKPSRCTAEILLGQGGLLTPVRRGRVVVTTDAGAAVFTGYLALEPAAVYVGAGVSGPVYRARLDAVSDEWLLDRQGSGAGALTNGLTVALDGASLLSQLTDTVQSSSGSASSSLSVTTGGSARALGSFAVQPGAGWSTNAAAAANATYASYRVLQGQVSVVPAGAVTHGFDDRDGRLNLAAFSTGYVRELANDVTVSGAEEPAAYVQEIFSGDGTTDTFVLSDAAYRGTHRRLLRDSFQQASFDSSQWIASDNGNFLQLSGAGLIWNGGNGLDGQTTLKALQAIEMGGQIVAELGGVVFGAGSDGLLAGFYNGGLLLSNCFAGFRVRQSVSTTGGVTVVVPLVNGVETGTMFTPASGHRYTLRLRLFCVEMQRVPQRYYCMVDGAVQEFGAVTGVAAPMHLVFELVDEGVSSNTPATVLFDTGSTPVAPTPATCSFVAVNSPSLYGSVASIEVFRPGSLWIRSTLPSGAEQTRLTGIAGQGVDCQVDYGSVVGSNGKVMFFSGRIPVAGERVSVFYRKQQRAVARLVDASSVAAEAAAGTGVQVPGVSRWLGKILQPEARSSADCEAAGSAVLAMATSRTAALRGSYALVNPTQDIWPGDVLQITSAGTSRALLVRRVEALDRHAVPELVEYKVAFANDWAAEWADGFGLLLSNAVANDAILPPTAMTGTMATLPNVQQAEIVSLSSTAMQVNAGMDPPAGGGFEVRRKDGAFGTGVGAGDLVLSSPVRSFSVPRSAQVERFYIRMYDGGTPALFSRFSSVLAVNWPFGS